MASKGSAAFRKILTITAIWGICFRSNRNPVGLNRWSPDTILARPKSSRSSLHFGQAKQIRGAERDQRLKCFASSSPTRSSAYNEKTFPLKNRVCEALCFKALRCKLNGITAAIATVGRGSASPQWMHPWPRRSEPPAVRTHNLRFRTTRPRQKPVAASLRGAS